MRKLPIDRCWIAIDLDGTILEKGYYPEFGPPMKNVVKALTTIQDMGFKIMIWTARTSLTDIEGRFQNVNKILKDIEACLIKNSIPFDYIIPSMHKPSLIYKMIDDKAIEFDGNWMKAVKKIKKDLKKRGIKIGEDKSKHLEELIL